MIEKFNELHAVKNKKKGEQIYKNIEHFKRTIQALKIKQGHTLKRFMS